MLLQALIIGGLISSCISNENDAVQSMLQNIDLYKPASNWSDSFDWQLLKSFAPRSRNVLISPISLKIALALLYEGSSGTTEQEFQTVLQFADKSHLREKYKNIINALEYTSVNREYLLNIGSRIFLDSQLVPQQKYRSKTLYDYHTDIEQTDFSNTLNASQSVNAWIDKVTNGKIPNLVSPEDVKDSVMLITNAVYFKGTWRHQFPKNQTRYGKFYISADEMVTVPYMMTSDRFYYHESVELEAKILRLPYKGNRYNMFIVLPNSRGGLDALIKKISVATLHRNMLYMEPNLVEVNIPKFRFNYQAKFTEVLEEYGLRQMFQNTASFPGIARGNSSQLKRLVVSDIMQKSGIELDEEGSVVYAATDITIGNKFGDAEYIFNATHPFMFFIEEQTNGTILFVGKVENPLELNVLPSRFGTDGPPPPPPGTNTILT